MTDSVTVARMTTPTTSLMPPAEAARFHLAQANDLSDAISQCRLQGHHEKAGRIAGKQRAEMKRAEVNALLAIADELARIGLAR